MMINIQAGWLGLLLCGIAGAVMGMFFHEDDFLGGYNSWSRRMVRLGHIAFFGIGIINLAFGLTARSLGIDSDLRMVSVLLIVGAVAMPTVCYLSAWKKGFRHMFFIPAGAVIVGVGLFIWRLFA